MKNSSVSIAAVLAAWSALPAMAQQSDWAYEATIYLFAPETTAKIATPVRTIEGKLSFSDALANLDFAFMGSFGASNGRWSFLADYMYTDLSFSSPPPGPLFTRVDTSMTTQILSGYVAYRVYDEPGAQIDLAGGFRWSDVKSSLTLQPVPPGGTNAVNDS